MEKNLEDHYENLFNLMKVMQDNDLIFNSAKCDIWQPNIFL